MSFIELDISGVEEVKKKLQDLSKNVADLERGEKVSFDKLFPSGFMKRYTTFQSIEGMIDASGYKVESPEDFKAIPDTAWDSFVKQRTKFNSWGEMLAKAGEEWTAKRLGFKQ